MSKVCFILVIAVLFAISSIVLVTQLKQRSTEKYHRVGETGYGCCANIKTCSGSNNCNFQNTLDPLFDPLYNLREAVKQLILLEDHLSHIKRRCPDCIKKHFLFVEALLDESDMLDKEGYVKPIADDAKNSIVSLQKKWLNSKDEKDMTELSQGVRSLRKKLVDVSYDETKKM